MKSFSQQLRTSVIAVTLITLFAGLIFPFVVTAIARVVFPLQAMGSLVEVNGKVVGSHLIAQGFSSPGYFHPRPSAAGNGYDPTSSGGTNLGPTSDKLINGIRKKLPNGKDDPGNFDGIKDLAADYRKENGLASDDIVPSDAVTRSASGLDPEISPENARIQALRVARARALSEAEVEKLVSIHTAGRQLGFLGEPRVNVLDLNLALDELAPGRAGAARK